MSLNVLKISDILSQLKLLKQAALVGHDWIEANPQDCIKVSNPANGEIIGIVPNLGATQAKAAITAAEQAFHVWRGLLAQQRAERLLNWHDLILENKEELALIMTLEQGKPINEARGEIDYAASFIQWYAEEAKRINVESVTPHLSGREFLVKRSPIGVTAAITPWNFPSAMVTRKAAAALAAGCTMVIRPASETPFSAIALAQLSQQADIPSGVISVVTGQAAPIADALCQDNRVRALSFTGSTEIGRHLLANAASTVKQVIMELGGHAPMIVFDDVDIDKATDGAIAAKFATSGQDCLAASRIFVHERIYDEFVERFSQKTRGLIVADGLDQAAQIGPLINERAVAKCKQHIENAIASGARLTAGGHHHDLGGLFYQPTVLADVSDEMLISCEETFGPVAAVLKFNDEQEVIQRANNTIYGLASYIWSNDLSRVHRVANALDYGMVAINCAKMTGPPVPFGGIKQSGLGREGARHGLEAFTELKYICMNIEQAA